MLNVSERLIKLNEHALKQVLNVYIKCLTLLIFRSGY